jgi:NAD(P)-dependent dehydrogenase (short-subunit alcohol dehydrogenase family)
MNNKLKEFAIVTGAGNGIGHAIAKQLKLDGFEVIGVDLEFINHDLDLEIVGDVTEKNTISKAQEMLNHSVSNIVLVNAAGISIKNIEEHNRLESFDKTININLRAPFIWSNEIAKLQIKIGKGRIINISSLASFMSFPDNPGYDSSKGGILQLTRSFAHLLGPYGVTCNSIAPGYIKTRMTEKSLSDSEIFDKRIARTLVKRIGNPEDIANVASFLASDKSDYITGQQIVVDGGYSVQGI